MTSIPPIRESDTQPIRAVTGREGERKRAALVLGVLAVVAVLVVGVLGYLLGSSDTPSSSSSNIAAPTGPAVQVTGGSTSSASSASTSSTPTSPAPTTSAAVSVPTGPVSCPTSARCIVQGDVGAAVAALNAYRAANGGAGTVAGKVTTQAQKCALASGDGPSCPSGYFWEPVGRSGTQVISKIAKSGTGKSWLLNAKLTVVQVGWVYIPSTKSFECVLVSNA